MNAQHPLQTELEASRMQASRDELVERLMRALRKDGGSEPLKGLRLHRLSAPTELAHSVSDPAFCVIAQGSKEGFLGEYRYQYDPMHYLLVTAELPIVSHVIEASPERPYLSLSLKLDPVTVGAVMVETGQLATHDEAHVRALDVSALDADLLDAILRLVRLLDNPTEAPFLAPLITREIIFRLLLGEQGDRLRYIATQGGHAHRIARAIERLRNELDHPLRVEDIARDLGMSVSSFHHHFKAVTAMSPLQFQKQVRLQEARRLMLSEDLDAATAGYRVGFNDPAHFNREYKKTFGLPPLSDVKRLREQAAPNERLSAG
ncbi:MAG: AraC family transcriptional regulator [Anaerolineae bacterium]|nr:AraC family transcriptional regulator [Anaerolineae bacterium]